MTDSSENSKSSDAYLGRRLAWVRDRLAKSDPEYRFKWDIYFDRLEELAQTANTFLDAGCGDNRTATELVGPRLTVGVDVVAPSIGIAVRGSLEQLPLRDGVFDLVGCRYVAEHLENPIDVWSELHRVMQPGGRILIQTVNTDSTLIKWSRRLGGSLRRFISRRRYARDGEDVFPVRDRFNAPDVFETPPQGFRCVSVTMTQDIDTQSRLGFHATHWLLRQTRNTPDKRSTITAEWERI